MHVHNESHLEAMSKNNNDNTNRNHNNSGGGRGSRSDNGSSNRNYNDRNNNGNRNGCNKGGSNNDSETNSSNYRFAGKTEKIKEHVCGASEFPQMEFMKSTKGMAEWVGKTMKLGDQIQTAMENVEECKIPMHTVKILEKDDEVKKLEQELEIKL